MKNSSKWGVLALVLLILSYPVAKTYETHHRHLPVFSLLVPEGSEKLPATEMWVHAAAEVGAPLEVISYNDFTSPFQTEAFESKAILIPDEVSQNASPTLISYLKQYVNGGGKIILVGDALMHDLNGRLKESFPAEVYFQFPELKGREGDTIQYSRDSVRINDAWIQKLKIPPGQYWPPDSVKSNFREFCTYQSLHAKYPHWKTSTEAFSGTPILEASDGSLVAGIQKIGLGQVLWINMPLSYLKRRTDGLIMHSFLRWISEDWLGLPHLLAVPNGVGGIVLNLHVDSNAAVPYLTTLKNLGFFSSGPYSIHVTAGPDAREANDGLGFNLDGNPENQEWVRYWIKLGHEVGSHGGWIHDYFGLHVTDVETPEFDGYLQKNYDSIHRVSNVGPSEYSAPLGNQPLWVNDWLRKRGYHSYYFVGDNGMGPTQNFRDNVFTDESLWSFPIASYGQVASFEEAEQQRLPRKEMANWLFDLTRFVSHAHDVRLFYFHPPGIRSYENTISRWLSENKNLQKLGQFQWYTMNRLSQFLTQRNELQWKVISLDQPGEFEIKVRPGPDLHEMVWSLSKSLVKNLKVSSGNPKIKEHDDEIQIIPGSDDGFSVRYEEVAHEI
jgi:hypothetical protein